MPIPLPPPPENQPAKRPFTPQMSDAVFRKRLTIAVAVSLAVNGFIWGAASLGAHKFLLSIRPKPTRIYVTRIIIPRRKGDDTPPTSAELVAAFRKAQSEQAIPRRLPRAQ